MKRLRISPLKMGALISYFTMAFNIIAGLIYIPWMVEKIGQSNYGLYTLANSLIAIFMLDFGLSSAVSRFVAKYRAESMQELVNDILGVIYKLYILIDLLILVVLAVVYIFLGDIYTELTSDELNTFKTLFLIVALYHLIAFPLTPVDGILNAYEEFISLKLCNFLYRFLSVAAVIVLLCFTSRVEAVILTTVLSHLIAIFLKVFLIRKKHLVEVNFRASGKGIYKNLFSFTIWTTVINIMQRFTHSFAPSVLGVTSGALEIGLYAPATTLEGYFFTFGSSINGMFLSRVSRHIADQEENKILELMIKVGRYQSVVLGLIYVGFLCLGKEFMRLWMGTAYENTYYLALIILFPTLISATQQIAKTTVIAKKLIKYQAFCMLVTGVFGLVFSYFTSIKYGALGVCLGTCITSLMNIAYMNIIYKRKAGINVFEFYKKCYLKLIPCYALTILAGFAIAKCISITGWAGLFIKAIMITAVFLVTMLLIYLTNDEKKLVLNIANKIRGK